jgi:hypothetical protein
MMSPGLGQEEINMSDKGKAVFAALYAIAAAVIVVLDNAGGKPTPADWVNVSIAVATAVTVYIAPIIPQAPSVKSAIGVLLAALQVLVTVIDGGVTGSEALLIAAAVAGALGIAVAPATSSNGTHVGWGGDAYTRAR